MNNISFYRKKYNYLNPINEHEVLSMLLLSSIYHILSLKYILDLRNYLHINFLSN